MHNVYKKSLQSRIPHKGSFWRRTCAIIIHNAKLATRVRAVLKQISNYSLAFNGL